MVIDLFSRQVVGWSLRHDMTRDIVIDALRMAWFKRHPGKQAGLMFHSDRGSQGLDCIRRWTMSARCSSSRTGMPISQSKPTNDLGYEIRMLGARSVPCVRIKPRQMLVHQREQSYLRFHSRHQQIRVASGSAANLKLTAPQRQPPVLSVIC